MILKVVGNKGKRERGLINREKVLLLLFRMDMLQYFGRRFKAPEADIRECRALCAQWYSKSAANLLGGALIWAKICLILLGFMRF